MYCTNCKTFNSDGRETCVNCGKTLFDIHGIMSTDRWVGAALKVLAWGCVVGGVCGTLVGIGLGVWLTSGSAGAAVTGAIFGLELGIPGGGIIGLCIGIAQHAPRR